MKSEILAGLTLKKFKQPFHAEQNAWWAKSGAHPRGAAGLHPPHQIKKKEHILYTCIHICSCDLPFG